jgi:hypothetical protein
MQSTPESIDWVSSKFSAFITDLKALNRTLRDFSAAKYFQEMTDFKRRAYVFIAFISNYQRTQLCRSVLIVMLTTLSGQLFSRQDIFINAESWHLQSSHLPY